MVQRGDKRRPRLECTRSRLVDKDCIAGPKEAAHWLSVQRLIVPVQCSGILIGHLGTIPDARQARVQERLRNTQIEKG